MRETLKSHLPFIFFFLVYACLSLINLDALPVAWTDEVLNLDPAIQHLEKGVYTSKLWPNPNSDRFFASYLPGIQWFQTVYLTFIPVEIFWIRLPFLLLVWGSILLFYRYLTKNTTLHSLWAGIWVALLFLDKSVFELSRSMRVEPLILFGTLAFLNIQDKKRHWLPKALLLGFLSMTHVYIWPFLLVWIAAEILQLGTYQRILFTFICAIPGIAFLASVNFDVEIIIEQMGFHAQQHTLVKTDMPHHPFLNSLWFRFYPFYKEQPLMPLLFYGLMVLIPLLFLKQKSWLKPQQWTYLGWILGAILVFGVMTPQYRYLPVFWIIGFALILRSNRINTQIPLLKAFCLLLLANVSLSFMGRHAAAVLQYQARNPKGVHDFLHKYLPNPTQKRTLILGESIGFYHAHRGRNHQRYDYGIDFYPQHFNWSDYDHVVLLSHEVRPQDSLIAIYESPKERFKTPAVMSAFAKGGTYNGMRVYSLK